VAPPSESDLTKDPVCGTLIGAVSPHRHVHGGAVFCFCSAHCRGVFIADPSRYVVFGGAPQAPIRPQTPFPEDASVIWYPPGTQMAEPGTRAATLPTVQLPSTAVLQTQAGDRAQARDPATLTRRQPRRRWRDLLAGLLPGRERRFAKRVSRDLLALYRTESARDPRLRGRDLYRTIVMTRMRADPDSADALLDQAEESYAAWPTRRPLRFRDVVHFLAVSEFLASHGDTPWIHENMKDEVDSQIPHNL
jgi:YHS domain-containing protein